MELNSKLIFNGFSVACWVELLWIFNERLLQYTVALKYGKLMLSTCLRRHAKCKYTFYKEDLLVIVIFLGNT